MPEPQRPWWRTETTLTIAAVLIVVVVVQAATGLGSFLDGLAATVVVAWIATLGLRALRR
jgi:heme A synthase